MKKIILTVAILTLTLNVFSQSTLRLGINFPMRSPEAASVPTYMNLVTESGAQIARQLTFGDIIWKTIEPTDNAWNFVYSDSVFMDYPILDYIGNLYCISMHDTIGYQVPWKACTDAGNPQCRWIVDRDSNDTKQYLDTVIKRYGNIIKYWEIGNEVENHTFPASFPPAQFVKFLKYNYQWIKSSDANAKIVIPSFIGTYGLPLQSKYDWLRNFFALGGGKYIDIIAYHDYNSWWTLPLHIDSITSIRDRFGFQTKPIWLTESSVSSNTTPITPTYASIDEQSADVWRRSCLAWSKGVELYIWHSLWSSAPPSEWQEFGIVDNNGKKKKSFHSYKLLSEKLTDFSSVNLISTGIINDDNANGGDGVWVIKFLINGQNKWVMWSPNNLSYSLTPSVNTKYLIQNVVPASISPNGEIANFTIDSVIVANGNSHIFNLSSLPIIIEEQAVTSINILNFKEDFLLYPNPSNDYLMVDIANLLNNVSGISFKNMMGKEIYCEKITNKTTIIQTKNWQSGIYFYEIKINNNNAKHGKILIIH